MLPIALYSVLCEGNGSVFLMQQNTPCYTISPHCTRLVCTQCVLLPHAWSVECERAGCEVLTVPVALVLPSNGTCCEHCVRACTYVYHVCVLCVLTHTSRQYKERGSVCVVCTSEGRLGGWAGGRALDCVRIEPQVQGTSNARCGAVG